MPRGLEDERDGGGFFERQIFGIGETVYFGGANELSAATVDHIAEVSELAAAIVEAGEARGAFAAGDTGGEEHLLAYANRCNLSSDLRNFAGHVAAGNMRKRNRHIRKTLAHPEIETVQGAGSDADQNFVGTHGWIGGFNILQDFRAAVLLKLDRFHFADPGFLEQKRPLRTVATSSAPHSQGRLTKNLPKVGVRYTIPL